MLSTNMTEKEFQQRVIVEAQLAGWHVYHTYDSRRSAAGFPDLTMVRPPRLIFAELKSAKGRVTPAQQKWIEDLSKTPAEVYVWRPADSETIIATLA